MIDLVARKSMGGEVCINKAKMHLARHEWGLARMAIEDGIQKGGLDDHGEVESLLQDILLRLGVGSSREQALTPKPGFGPTADPGEGTADE